MFKELIKYLKYHVKPELLLMLKYHKGMPDYEPYWQKLNDQYKQAIKLLEKGSKDVWVKAINQYSIWNFG